MRYFWVKPSDVSIYVERGAADVGVAGRDILLEYERRVRAAGSGIGRCRYVRGRARKLLRRARPNSGGHQIPHITAEHYTAKSRDIDIIKLNGSIELAPILGLSDVIVDIVETGKTLLENHLAPLETIVDISAWLISSRVSYQSSIRRSPRCRRPGAEAVRRS